MSCREGRLTACGCCEGIAALTPAELFNRSGLSALAYRIGTHARFKFSMLAEISTRAALRELTTRQDDDQAIAAFDAWAVVLDVLTFYQERIANEGFLRTAVERRSLLELARLIGYELRPGVAAGTHLAFTLDGSEGSPRQVVIAAGTRAQSVPGQDELPQTFETSDEIVARPQWNALLPRAYRNQTTIPPDRVVALEGIEADLRVGSRILAVSAGDTQAFKVSAVEADASKDVTTVTLAPVDPAQPDLFPSVLIPPAAVVPPVTGKEPLTQANLGTYVLARPTWPGDELLAQLERLGWSIDAVEEHLAGIESFGESSDLELHALRAKVAFFGHNAPLYSSIPEDWRTGTSPPYPATWEGRSIRRTSQGDLYDPSGRVVFLDRPVPEILLDSWLLLESPTDEPRAYEVESTVEATRADYGMSAKATRLTLKSSTDLGDYGVRETTGYAVSERLDLAPLEIIDDVEGTELELAGFQLRLLPGSQVIVSGERTDLPDVTASEVMTLANVTHSMTFGHTTLTFARELAYRYKRATVTLSANVAAATHGETRREVLGSGDASIPFQRFVLRQKPLTYVSAPVPSGGESTLALRVGGILWHESPDLYRLAPDERGYALRLDDEGYTRAIFGDGIHGARLPTGIENVTGIYRIGIGVGGLLGPLRITLLPSPPLGVRSVTNPVATSGAEDPETRDQARENAPITVRTMERIVSLRDFEDFAATFSGIGKARADRIWDGARRLIFVTVSDAIGEEVEEEAELLVNLEEAMNRARDPFQPMAIGSYQRVLFTLEARLKIHPDYESEVVEAAVEKTLRASFSFTARRFGQSVHRSEVVALIQGVEGVEAVDLEALDFVPPGPGGLGLEDRLDGLPARLGLDSDGNPVVIGAQLVTLSPASIVLEEIP
jgi:hypothetical protein